MRTRHVLAIAALATACAPIEPHAWLETHAVEVADVTTLNHATPHPRGICASGLATQSGELASFVTCMDRDGALFLVAWTVPEHVSDLRVIDESTVVYLTPDGRAQALDLEAHRLWSLDGIDAIGSLLDGLLIATRGDTLMWIDAGGTVVRTAAVDGPFTIIEPLTDGGVIAGRERPYEVSRIASDGRRVWSAGFPRTREGTVLGIATANDVVWVATWESRDHAFVHALHADDGTPARSHRASSARVLAIDDDLIVSEAGVLRTLEGRAWSATYGASGMAGVYELVVSGDRLYAVGTTHGHGRGVIDFATGPRAMGFVAVFAR